MFDFSKKAVLWDLDDTLYSRFNAARSTFPGLFRELLYPSRSDQFIQEAVAFMMTRVYRNSMIHEDAFNALLDRYPPDKPYDRQACLDYYYAHISAFTVPFPETIEIIKMLRSRGIKNAIVTNILPHRLDSQRRKVEVLGIADLFDLIVFSGELGIHKPDRGIFDHVSAQLGLTNDQCLFVGDDPESDVAGALNAGMEVVWIDRWPWDGCYKDHPQVHRVAEITEFFPLNSGS